ncbi:MAG: Nramp family divalent metal transporter [Sediminicola sp.]
MFRNMGPGVLVAAAFIGPGTVTACTLAGLHFGYALLWAMGLSMLATMVLQEMSARLGLISQKGLAEVIRQQIGKPFFRYLFLGIILCAIVIGNAAYEGGNIGGAGLGLEAFMGPTYSNYHPFVIGAITILLLAVGNYKLLEKVLVSLVIIMSISFLLTAMVTKPDFFGILKGLFVPRLPKDSILTVIALVGTTVVPYNLFLHASLVGEKWKRTEDLKMVKRDTFVAILVGGLVSMAVIIAATTIPVKDLVSVLDMAKSLEPLYGNAARYFMGVGLFAAGITSAITAPLAAAYVAQSCFGWQGGMKDPRFKSVWLLIVVMGMLSLSLGIKPLEVIKFAQIANGVLLPVVAVFLVWVVNRKGLMGIHKNTPFQNVLGILTIVMSLFLGLKSIFKVIGTF